jgi:hypothetical protein
LRPDAPLTLVPAESLDQGVRQGPLAAEALEAAGRRVKQAIIERALGGALTQHVGDARTARCGIRRHDPGPLRARMTVRESQGVLADLYAVEVSPDLMRTGTDAIVAAVTAGSAGRWS